MDYAYRCRLTGMDGGTVYTDVVHIVPPLPSAVISVQPTDVGAPLLSQATFTFTASNVAVYQWEYCQNGRWADLIG